MSSADTGLNKPFDRILEAFADEAPELLLRLLSILPLGAVFTLAPLRPETAPPVILPDYVAVLWVNSGDPFIFHVEFGKIYVLGAKRRRKVRWQSRLAVSVPRRVGAALASAGRRSQDNSYYRRIRDRKHPDHSSVPHRANVGNRSCPDPR
jgi:hypothetical protein